MKDINNKEMFPIQQSYSKEEQIKRYWKCNYTTVESQLAYWILLPKDVKPVQIEKQPIEGLDINNIGQYVSIDKTCPMLEVSVYYEHCWYEMNSADWLAKKLHLMGENILHYRKINGISTGTYADILTTKIINNDKSIISRFTVLKDYDPNLSGANYFMVKASCFEEDYQKRMFDILQITNNWDLINKTNWNMAEIYNHLVSTSNNIISHFISQHHGRCSKIVIMINCPPNLFVFFLSMKMREGILV